MRKVCFSILVVALLPAVTVAQERQDQVPALVQRTGGAVVSISVFDSQGAALGQATGFLLSDGRIVTNFHALEGAARVEVLTATDELLGTATYAVNLSSRVDVAILPRIGEPPAFVALSEREPEVGESIVVIGSPRGFANTVSDGIVSAYRTMEGRRLMQTTAPISPGSSGSPVIDAEGAVVGMSVGILPDAQNVNFAIPARDIRAVAGSPPGRVEFPSASDSYASAAMEKANDTDYRVIEVGDEVEGRLESSDAAMADSSYGDMFLVSGTPGEAVTIELRSSDFDPYLIASDAMDDEAEVLEDDDGGSGNDARIRTTLPPSGVLGLIVNSYTAGETGAYKLLVTAAADSVKSGRWHNLGETAAVEYAYDRMSIRPQPQDRYRVWVRFDFLQVGHNEDGSRYDRMVSDFEFACKEREYRIYATYQYLGDDSGKYWSGEPTEWTAWAPESPAEKLGEAVCKGDIQP